jgi:hypothetical protein
LAFRYWHNPAFDIDRLSNCCATFVGSNGSG